MRSLLDHLAAGLNPAQAARAVRDGSVLGGRRMALRRSVPYHWSRQPQPYRRRSAQAFDFHDLGV
jgi:hypothetical protein